MGIFDLFKFSTIEPVQEPRPIQEDLASKWRGTDLYQKFLLKVELQIEIHIDAIKEKNSYFDDSYCREDMYCVDVTEKYYRLRTITDSDHRFNFTHSVNETAPRETVLIGVSFFDMHYDKIDYKQIRGFHDAICSDLKRFEKDGVKITSYYDDGEDGWPNAYIWIDFKECYRKLKSVF